MKYKFVEFCLAKGDSFSDCVAFYNEHFIQAGELIALLAAVSLLGLVIGLMLGIN